MPSTWDTSQEGNPDTIGRAFDLFLSTQLKHDTPFRFLRRPIERCHVTVKVRSLAQFCASYTETGDITTGCQTVFRLAAYERTFRGRAKDRLLVGCRVTRAHYKDLVVFQRHHHHHTIPSPPPPPPQTTTHVFHWHVSACLSVLFKIFKIIDICHARHTHHTRARAHVCEHRPVARGGAPGAYAPPPPHRPKLPLKKA